MTQRLAIAIHDVSPLTLEPTRRLVQLIEDIAGSYVCMTLLVIPQHHRRCSIDQANVLRAFIDHRLARGDEVALHGMWHLDEGTRPRSPIDWWRRRVLTDKEGEFAAIDAAGARMRIEQGLALFARCGWRAQGFVPPAWQINQATQSVLRQYELRYYTTRDALVDIGSLRRIELPVLSLSARSPLRRCLSRSWARRWLQAHDHAPSLRFALHPSDAQHLETIQIWRSCLHRTLPRTTRLTKAGLLE